ncbi:MAG: class I SAM-dependent methyltransferase, partial [Winkia neuii]|nr:class I SAM-dependent methyltransferase [Winkia neuii]
AYDYLVESIRAWPAQEELGRMIAANGWSEVEYRNLTGGIACMHRAVKPLP